MIWRNPILYGAMPNEFITSKYLLGTLTYRIEILFFLFYEIRYTTGFYNYQLSANDNFTDPSEAEIQYFNSKVSILSTAITTGFLWDSMLVFEYAYNFDILRGDKKGGYSFIVNFMKVLW